MFHMHDCFALPCCYAGYFEKTRSKQLMLRDQGNWSAALALLYPFCIGVADQPTKAKCKDCSEVLKKDVILVATKDNLKKHELGQRLAVLRKKAKLAAKQASRAVHGP